MAASVADIMSRNIVSVTSNSPVSKIAALLSQHGISAVPVIDKDGKPLGMVSEGDLMAPFSARNQARRDWWLEMLAEGERLAPEFLDYISADHRTAADVMTREVVSVGEGAAVADVADILIKHRIKRVPVLRDGRVVGIISRADIVRSLAPRAPR
jgi:CBS domain-containing protein